MSFLSVIVLVKVVALSPSIGAMEPSRRWGDDTAILDDEEARRRLLDAAARCIVRRGNTQIRMAEVADEAGVSRSTVYRYFPGRDDLLLGLMLTRIDTALGDLVRGLRHPDDPMRSLPEMVMVPVVSVEGNPLNEALFAGGAPRSRRLSKWAPNPSWNCCCTTTSRCCSDGNTRADCTMTSTTGRSSSG